MDGLGSAVGCSVVEACCGVLVIGLASGTW